MGTAALQPSLRPLAYLHSETSMTRPDRRSLLLRRAPFRSPAGPHLQRGRWGYALAWLLGVPLPILLIIYLLRGCS